MTAFDDDVIEPRPDNVGLPTGPEQGLKETKEPDRAFLYQVTVTKHVWAPDPISAQIISFNESIKPFHIEVTQLPNDE